MTAAERVDQLRQAAGWLLSATVVLVVDFRIGSGGDPQLGLDLVNDLIGAALVVPGISRLRAASQGTPQAERWASWAWTAAVLHVPLVLIDEMMRTVGQGGAGRVAVDLLALPAVFGGTAAAATAFRHTIADVTSDVELAERWRRVVPWMLFAGALPALVTTFAGVGLALGGVAGGGQDGGLAVVVVLVGLALGVAALVVLVTALSRTRQLPDPVAPAPNGNEASAS